MGFGSFLKQSLREQLGSWDNFTDGFKEGFFGTDYVRDYSHASKTFVADGQALAPTNKFLFHVFFTINPEIPGLSEAMGGSSGQSTIGLLVKTAQLPSYTFEIETMNQYNRKRYVQSKIEYRPVTLTLHDDGSDIVRSMWYNYYNYYFNDPDYGYDGRGTNAVAYRGRDIYTQLRNVNDWGYDGTGFQNGVKPNFFKDIKIYGFNKGKFTSYTLINPIITDFMHDTFDYSAGNGIMQHTITLSYETVKYQRGNVGSDVRGFGDPANYDTRPSPIRPGTTRTLFGPGGILDSGNSILEDLASGNILGAIRTGGSLRNTLKGTNIKSLISSELVSGAISSGLNFLSNNGANSSSPFSIPSFGSNFGLSSGSIINSAKGLFGGTSFDSLAGDFNLGGLSNTFDAVAPSINALKEKFSSFGSELNSDYNSLFKNMQSSVQGSMNVLENEVSSFTSQIDTSTLPNITGLVNSIPSADSLVSSATNVASDISKSFAPVADSVSANFKSIANSSEVRTLTNQLSNIAGDVISNGSNISQ